MRTSSMILMNEFISYKSVKGEQFIKQFGYKLVLKMFIFEHRLYLHKMEWFEDKYKYPQWDMSKLMCAWNAYGAQHGLVLESAKTANENYEKLMAQKKEEMVKRWKVILNS